MARTIAMYKHLRMKFASANFTHSHSHQQDVNGNGWPGSGCYIDGYLCSVLFLDVFSLILVSGRAAHSKSAVIRAFLAVNTLPIAGSAFAMCVFKRGT